MRSYRPKSLAPSSSAARGSRQSALPIVSPAVTVFTGFLAGAEDLVATGRIALPLGRKPNHGRLANGKPKTLGGSQEHHDAVGSDASTVKRSDDLLASDGWKPNSSTVSSGMAGVARNDRVNGVVSTPSP
jgi:hypothetical protein